MTADELATVVESLSRAMVAALDDRLREIVHEEVSHLLAAQGVI